MSATLSTTMSATMATSMSATRHQVSHCNDADRMEIQNYDGLTKKLMD